MLIIELISMFVKCICMYYHRSLYTLWNHRVHSVIDDITGPVACAGEAEPLAEEANSIPLGELIEWT